MTDSLKVLVTIGASSDLRAEIDRFEPRDRAGRIRELATLGLQLVRQAGDAQMRLSPPLATPPPAERPQDPQSPSPPLADAKEALIEKLKRSLQ
jgi:hypothetical protein